MSNDQAIEHRLALVEGATDTLIKRTDRIEATLSDFRTEVKQEFANIQQDLRLIIEMYRSQKTQLDRMEATILSLRPGPDEATDA
jgi:hypothetical protein